MMRGRFPRHAGRNRRLLLPLLGLLLVSAATVRAEEVPDGLNRLDFMVGEWRGTSQGQSGDGTVERSCMRVLDDRFIECRTTVTYPPQEKNRKGDVHVERALYSYDKRAKMLRLRQFHGEGFVNGYSETEPLVFETAEIENLPPGWRARETYRQVSAGSWAERFELAGPGKEFAVYTSSMLERVKLPAAGEGAFDPELAKRVGADARGMKHYILCILKTGPKDAEVQGDERKKIFAGHFANIGNLAEEGKLVVAGPFAKNDKAYRGLYIFNVATIEEAEKLVMLDPAVQAGVFVPELTPWYGSAAMMVVSETHKRIEKPAE